MKVNQKIFFIVSSAIILFVSLLCFAEYISSKIDESYEKESGIEYNETWDGSEDYPFDEVIVTVETSEEYGNQELATDRWYNLKAFYRKAKTRFIQMASNWTERATSSNPLYYNSVLINQYFDKCCGFNVTTAVSAENDVLTAYDVVVDLGDGYLGTVTDQKSIEVYGEENIAALIEFGVSIKSDGRNFLYVAAPNKTEMTTYSGIVSQIYPDSSSELTEMVITELTNADLDVVSILSAMDEDGIDALDAFYKTDHHWNVKTGIYACKVISEAMNSFYSYAIDTSLYDLESYSIMTIGDYWIGSSGKKATEAYINLEDLDIYLPKYNTDFVVYNSDTDSTMHGSLENTLLNWEAISQSQNKYTFSAYSVYGYGNLAYLSVHNNLITDGSSVLVIRTSYGNCVVPYLAAAVENLYAIDLREFTGCLEDFIDDLNPDTVIVLYDTQCLVEENNWDHTSLFDFR